MPLASVQVSVNGAAAVTGGVDVPTQATIQLSAPSTVGWLRCRWEVYDYPEGWPTPAGWTLDSTGVIYSTAFTPTLITLLDAGVIWGVWMARLLVNEQLDDDKNVLPGLLDDTCAWCMLSPAGLRDMGGREGEHFTTATTRLKKWVRSYQRNLRSLENPKIATTSADATPILIRRYPVADGEVKVLRAVVKVRTTSGATGYGEYEVKGAWRRVAGVLSQLYAPVITTVIESNAALNVTIALNGNTDVDLKGTGLAATNLTWEAQESFF